MQSVASRAGCLICQLRTRSEARQYRRSTASAERSVANKRNDADGPRSSYASTC
jgi:hypothetical protein